MPLAFGLPYAALTTKIYNKDLLNGTRSGIHGGGFFGKNQPSAYGYILNWNDIYAPAALYELQQAGVNVKVATVSFRTLKDFPADEGIPFPSGSIFIPIQQQVLSSDNIFQVVKRVAEKNKVQIKSVESGLVTEGNEFGSSKFVPVTKPAVALIVGSGVNATDAGEVWHLLDQRMNIPSAHIEASVFNRVDLNKYNTLIMVGGSYPDLNKDKLKSWVQAGGILILTEEAVTWASQNGITDVKFKRTASPVDSSSRLAYTDREQINGAQQIQGAIFGAEADLAHPLAYGYSQKTVSLFKANKVFMEKSKNPYATPFYYGSNPLQSGWVSNQNYEAIKKSAAVIISTVGNGRVINIADNPNFRAFWLGGSKLFMNAVFFGRIIDPASGRTEE
jgi:hypothetical protein